MVVFAIMKLASQVIDPETRKLVGQTTKEVNKAFDGADAIEKIAEWAKHHQAHSCSLLFETE